MHTNIVTLDIRCGYCNKKLSEVTPPVTLMIQRIKCPRCGEIVETYIIKPTDDSKTLKPRYNPIKETQIIKPDETKAQEKLRNLLTLSPDDIKELEKYG